MPLKNTPETWGSVHKALHWLIALAVVGLLVVGWIMDEMPNSPDKIKVYALHKSFGITVLALMLARLAWRWTNPRPELPATMKGWERTLAGVVHGGLYAALLAMPLSGWLFNSASNFPLKWFGLFSIPPLSGPDRDLKHLAEDVHWALSWVIVTLVVMHVAGALKHHFVDRDEVLRRMLPGRRAPSPATANPETAP
jgi:cytochrome b561